MSRLRDVFWWYWLLNALALAAGLGGLPRGVPIAMALTAQQALHLVVTTRRPGSLAVQVRLAYLGLLALGDEYALPGLHVAMLAGTSVRLIFDYCGLARLLSLLPWNRRGPLTVRRVVATFVMPPVHGSLLAALEAYEGSGSLIYTPRHSEIPRLR